MIPEPRDLEMVEYEKPSKSFIRTSIDEKYKKEHNLPEKTHSVRYDIFPDKEGATKEVLITYFSKNGKVIDTELFHGDIDTEIAF